MAAGKGHGRFLSPQLAIIVEAAHIRVAGTIHGVGPRFVFWSEHFGLTGLVPFTET
jgi:hypothetical protein